MRAGRVAAQLAPRRQDRCRARPGRQCSRIRQTAEPRVAPLVLNPHGLEEFGATNPGPSPAEARRVPTTEARRSDVRRAAAPYHRDDRALDPDRAAQHLLVESDRFGSFRTRSTLRWLERSRHKCRRCPRSPRGRHGRDEPSFSRRTDRGETKVFTSAAALGGCHAHGGRLPDGRWRWSCRRRTVPQPSGRLYAPPTSRLQRCSSARLDDRVLHAWYEPPPSSRIRRSMKAVRSSRSRRWRTVGAVGRDSRGWICPTSAARRERMLVEPGDVSALAGAISGAIDEPALLALFGPRQPAPSSTREFSWKLQGRRRSLSTKSV